MRILHISSAREFGGGERHFVDLTRGLGARGHEVFASVRPTCQWKDRLDVFAADHLFEVSIRNSFGILSAIRIADFVRENKIDIVHAHVARDYIPASIACLVSKARFVLTRHVLFPLKPFNKFALKNLDRAIGVSDAVGANLKRIFPAEKVNVIYNGIDTNACSIENMDLLRVEFRAFHGLPLDAPLVGTLGELKELKGQREFVLAAAEIVKQIPHCRFVIAGRDNSLDKKYRRELKRLAAIFELEGKILWLDWLEDTRPFYAAIDVFVSPSRSESFGLAILEAMASDVAVVATETEGAKQLLGINGNFAQIENAVDIAQQASSMLKDERVREAAATDARQRASALFNVDRMIEETESLYESILLH
ncbi:MAG: glycosyltransferase family 4 protein [Pyrinomonadaceae bacterium]